MFLVLCVTQAIASVVSVYSMLWNGIGQSTNRFGKPPVIIYNVLQIPNGKTMDERILAKEYNPHPMESETKESETDEGRDLEYFHVPADNRDNRTAAADYLVDFKTVSF